MRQGPLVPLHWSGGPAGQQQDTRLVVILLIRCPPQSALPKESPVTLICYLPRVAFYLKAEAVQMRLAARTSVQIWVLKAFLSF